MNKGICQECGKPGVIHIHHKDGNHENDVPTNRIDLCPSCHVLTHANQKEPRPYQNKRKEPGLPREIIERQYLTCFPRV